MGKKAFVLGVVLLCAAAASEPASAQVAGGALPPGYEVEEDGTLVIGGDVVVRCSEVGLLGGDPGTNDPAVLSQINESVRESVAACESAGFPTSADPAPGAAASDGASDTSGVSAPDGPAGSAVAVLPDTGGLPLLGLIALGAVLSVAAGAASVALLRTKG